MKRTVFRVLSVIMALCVFLGAMPVMAFAVVEDYVLVAETIDFNPETELEIKTDLNISKIPQYSSGATNTEGWRFYNQLTDIQKEYYEIFLNAGVTEVITITLDTPYTATGTTGNIGFQNALGAAQLDLIAAISAVAEDNPLIFWIDGFGLSGSGYTSGKTGVVTSLQITINLDLNSYANFTVVQEKYNELVTAVNSFKVNGINRYEKLKSINDQLCDLITYPDVWGYFGDGSPFYGPMAHEPTGALLNGSAVCEGYAEALKLICDREGIPCIMVVGQGGGGAHKWNYVQMDDGLWYLVDTTWNDWVTYKSYDCFITGSDFDGGDHINTGRLYIGVDFALSYPTLSKENYQISVLMDDTGDMAYNNTNNVLYVGKEYTTIQSVAESIGLPNNCEISWTSYFDVTGQVIGFTNTTTSAEKTYLVAMRGDIDASNTTNTTDYNKIIQTCATTYKVVDGTANFYAGDMNQDGAIDGFDAIALDLYIDGTITFN